MPPLPARRSGPALVAADGVTPLSAALSGDGFRFGGQAHIAASDAPEFKDWWPAGGSADADQAFERRPISWRARDLARNDPLASGHIRSTQDNAIGWGLRFSAAPDYRALGLRREEARAKAAEIEAIWNEWSGDADCCDVTMHDDFGALTRSSVCSDLTDGESLAVLLWDSARAQAVGSRFATYLQVVEADRLSNPNFTPDTETLRDGIALDSRGAAMIYWFRTRHPGDRYLYAAAEDRWEPVPSRWPDGRRRVVHCFERQRPGQHRGVSPFASVMKEFKMRDRYGRAELQAAVVNAVIAAVLQTPLDGESIQDLFGDAKEWLKVRNETPRPPLGIGAGGLIPRLAPGEQLHGYNAGRPNAAFDPFMTMITRLIAAGLGTTYEKFMRDFSRCNYSSARASLLEAALFIQSYRIFKTLYWCKPVLTCVLEEAVWRGYIDLPGFKDSRAVRNAWCRGTWLGPSPGWVDPVKEVEAAALRIQLGISCLRDEAAANGYDWLDLLDQLALEQEELGRRNLSLPEVSFAAVARTAAAPEQPVQAAP